MIQNSTTNSNLQPFFFVFLSTYLWTNKRSHGVDIRDKALSLTSNQLFSSHLRGNESGNIHWKQIYFKNSQCHHSPTVCAYNCSHFQLQNYRITQCLTLQALKCLFQFQFHYLSIIISCKVRVPNAFLGQCFNRCVKPNADCWKQELEHAALQVKAECQIPLC